MAFLNLPQRPDKPRNHGLTIALDGGLPTKYFIDVISSHGHLIDLVKFGWGTALVTHDLKKKIHALKEADIPYFLGGSLFEKAILTGQIDGYRAFCRELGCKYVEVSNGTIDMENSEKANFITAFAKEFLVISEVGFKDAEKSINLPPMEWIKFIKEDLKAGAWKVLMEARESGTSGICRENGELRFGLIKEILASDLSIGDLVFEAPNKDLQTYFIKQISHNVNLANITFSELLNLETLRLGLRFDTFYVD